MNLIIVYDDIDDINAHVSCVYYQDQIVFVLDMLKKFAQEHKYERAIMEYTQYTLNITLNPLAGALLRYYDEESNVLLTNPITATVMNVSAYLNTILLNIDCKMFAKITINDKYFRVERIEQ